MNKWPKILICYVWLAGIVRSNDQTNFTSMQWLTKEGSIPLLLFLDIYIIISLALWSNMQMTHSYMFVESQAPPMWFVLCLAFTEIEYYITNKFLLGLGDMAEKMYVFFLQTNTNLKNNHLNGHYRWDFWKKNRFQDFGIRI